jgi:superfamily I DNA and/or RNA helicase
MQLDEGKGAAGFGFFNLIYNGDAAQLQTPEKYEVARVSYLNESQQQAVAEIAGSNPLVIIHGPPGTGKTTTLVEAIAALVQNGEKVLVTAPSNAATDHIALQLIKRGVKTMRVGNQAKIHQELLPHTLEGKLQQGAEQQQLKKMRIQAEAFRKMAHQYKRHFGKADRDQRKLLMQEVKSIRKEIRALQTFYAEKWIEEASVICGTPIGLHDETVKKIKFNTLVIDEAGQCLESLAWAAITNTQRLVLAGDHLQLPPTVISEEAIKKGYNKSFLEVVIAKYPKTCLLDTQYRMREAIVAFSNKYFYEGQLKTPATLKNTKAHFVFYDTAGTGFQEEQGTENSSLTNPGELDLIQQLLEAEKYDLTKCALITPYSGQVALAKERLPKALRISTVDSFQGQECETIFISMVRSNDDAVLGFLTDYRRMNVALTRAKEQLIVVGDSVTFGSDKFFSEFLNHCQQHDAYHSAWEIMG